VTQNKDAPVPIVVTQTEMPALRVMSQNEFGNDYSVPDTSGTDIETFSSCDDEDAAVERDTFSGP
jgi:hypothetical protein